jgi:hypothetical protein
VSGVGGAAEVQRVAALTAVGDNRHAAGIARGVPQRAFILIILGALLGPLYQYYIAHYSGRQTATVELRERAERWSLPDGTIQRFRSGLAYRPTVLDLHPDRNRVRLSLTFQMAANPLPAVARGSGNEYETTLLEFDHPLQRHALKIDAAPGSSQTIELPALDVRAPGQHLFVLEEVGKPGREVAAVRLTVTEEVERFVQPVAWVGTAMLMAGLAWLAWALYRPARR